MKLGLFGGTFDPVHLGHLLLAETAREACGLDEVWFVPARIPPHKQTAAITSPKARLEMLELAIAGHPQFRVDDLELRRDGPSFTVDTLRHLHDQRPADDLHVIIGADSLADLPTWKEPLEILRLAVVIAVNRGRSVPDLPAALENFGDAASERIHLVEMPAVDISATDLRDRCRSGKSIRYQVPRPVELYIQQHHLYAG